MGVLGIEGIEQEAALGRGAFGVVYRAWQPTLQRQVAVKVLSGAFDPASLRRFERECGTVGSLSGEPGIVTVYAAGRTADGAPYLVMPYLPGGSLADRLQQGPMPPAQVASTGIAIGRALAAAHARGVLHLDVKPANVLLDAQDRPHLADFGIARFVDAEQRGHTATVAGTPGFAAPEIFDGRQPDVRSDVYSLGATLHALAGGRTPFTLSAAGGLSALLHQIAHEEPPDLRPSGVPEPLCDVVRRAMAKDPAQRYATAAELVEALESISPALGAGSGGRSPLPPTTSPVGSSASPAGTPASTGAAIDDEPDTLDEEQLLGFRRRPRLVEDQPDPAEATVIRGSTTAASPPAAPGATTASGPPPRSRRAVVATVAVLAVLGAAVAAVALRPGGGPEPAEDLAVAEVESVESGQLRQWLVAVRGIYDQLFLVPAESYATTCRDGLERLEDEFGAVEAGSARLIPAQLGPPIAAQGEPARSLWVDLVDTTTVWLRDCAARELTAEEDTELRARIEAIRLELSRVLSADTEGA